MGEEQEERRGSQSERTRVCNCPTLTHGQRNVFFRPSDRWCSCHDYALHGTCCHLLAAAQLPEFEGLNLLAPAAENGDEVSHSAGRQGSVTASQTRQNARTLHESATFETAPHDPLVQPIIIPAPRTFQQPKSEPLGPDMGSRERAAIIAAHSASTATIRRAQSNAEPLVAQLHKDLSYVSHAAVTLPREQLAEVADKAAALRQAVEGMLTEAQLPHTETAAGKKERRASQRSTGSKENKTRQPWHRKTRVLLPGRTSKRKRDEEAAEHPNSFPQYLNSKKQSKVRG